MVYQISVVQQALRRPGWGGIRPAPAGWLTVGRGGALAGPRRAERGPLQLAEGSAGQRGQQVDAFRALVARQGGVRVLDERGLVEGVAGAKGDPRGDLLAPAL